eukprot:gene1059-1343_t
MSHQPIQSPTAYFVDVIVPLPIDKLLTYSIPAALVTQIVKGSRVAVSLGAKKVLIGIAYAIHQVAPTYPVKPLLDVLDSKAIMNGNQLSFFQWIAQYYMCTLGDVLKAALPSGFKLTNQSEIYLHPDFSPTSIFLSKEEQQIIKALHTADSLSYLQVEQLLGRKVISPLLKQLENKQAIMLVAAWQEKYTSKKEKQVSLHAQFLADAALLQELFQVLEKKPKQLDVLLRYMTLLPPKTQTDAHQWVSKKQLLDQGMSSSAFTKLLQQNTFIEQTQAVSRIAQRQITADIHDTTLHPAQAQALEEISQHFTHTQTVVLHGVTGSGKTEIYIRLIQSILEHNGQVLYLLPEIGLATQMVQRLTKLFGPKMGVYHSKYDSNERVEIWNQLLDHQVQLVIGARSALFLPFDNLQLIIVDEEHEVAYKQLDATPRYHARDAALMLATFHQAKVLLGSATPSIETYYNVQQGKYKLVTLTERYNQTPLPHITLINVTTEQQRKRMRGEFTETLLTALSATLQQQEQVIIFQNRRGYAPYLLCQTCAAVPTCQHCSVSLTYHQLKDTLLCHYCGYHCQVSPTCPSCGASALKTVGFGTEKIEETLQHFFPDKQIQRMDLDTTRGKNSYETILSHLESGKTQILVGTQMITKGLDFGQVSLVGVFDVDKLLYFPNFRAHERCFQIITQVSGRAGRRNKQGQVLIQTTNPDLPILQDIVHYDYEKMYKKELLERQKFRYPPYIRLLKITCQHNRELLTHQAAQALASQLIHLLGEAPILGPQAPLVSKIKNLYRMDVWVKLEKSSEATLTTRKQQIQQITQGLLSQKLFRQVQVIFDVDPI